MGHYGKSPFLAGHHLNPPLKSHIYTYVVIKVMAFWEISPLAPTFTLNSVLCMAKWEISNISVSVWPVGL